MGEHKLIVSVSDSNLQSSPQNFDLNKLSDELYEFQMQRYNICKDIFNKKMGRSLDFTSNDGQPPEPVPKPRSAPRVVSEDR